MALTFSREEVSRVSPPGEGVTEMEEVYRYETFGADSGVFDREFTFYLNRMRSEGWKVKSCSAT
jgi:hypothetical protein